MVLILTDTALTLYKEFLALVGLNSPLTARRCI